MSPQNSRKTRAILVVSFGTAVEETRSLTLDSIENAIRNVYPEYAHYRAWTSKILRAKVLETEAVQIDGVSEAMLRMKQDGIQDVIIQPTFVSDGAEYEKLKTETLAFYDRFHSICLGLPLLCHSGNDSDILSIISAIVQEFSPIPEDELLILMGHGALGSENQLYDTLDTEFKTNGHKNIFVKTMTSESAIDELISIARERRITKIHLAPFMIVAGRHALKDMAGNSDTSWKSRFEHAGFSVQCIMKGLGEISAIQNIFISRIGQLLF